MLFGNKAKRRGRQPNRPTNGHVRPKRFPKVDKHSSWRYMFAFLSFVAWIIAIIVGAFVMAGCTSKTSALRAFYLAELHTNATYDIQFQVGYFGSCVSIANLTEMPDSSSNVADNSNNKPRVHCLSNMYDKDLDDLEEEFLEDMDLPDHAEAQLKVYLNQTFPIARNLQKDVFHWSAPLFDLVLFFIGGILLFALSINPSVKLIYKLALVLAVLIGAFALALAFTSTLGSLYSLNALVNGDKSKKERTLSDNMFIARGNWLPIMQDIHLGLVAVCYISIGLLYISPSTPRSGNKHHARV